MKTKFLVCLLCLQGFISITLSAEINFEVSSEDGAPIQETEFKKMYRDDSLLSFKSPKGFLPFFLNNTKRQATSFLHMNESQAYFLMLSAGVTATLYYFDQEIDGHFKPLEDKHRWLRKTSPVVTEFGDYYGYAFLALTGVYGMASENHKLFHTAYLAGQSAFSAGVWCRVGKVLTGRMRPGQTYGDAEYPTDHWFGPFGQFNKKERGERGIGAYDAFPSGHTAAAFSIATVYASRYSDRPAVAWISYTLAVTVAVTRLVEHEHWASDLIPGALIGYGCGRQVLNNYYRLFPKYKNPDYRREKKKNYSFIFAPSNRGLFCRLTF